VCNLAKTVLVAGRENKTLTRQLVKAVLETKFKVYSVSDGVHVDMAPWQNLHPIEEYCLMELREDHPLIDVLPQTIAPDILILTGETPALDALLASMPAGGTVVCPTELMGALPADLQVIPYGKGANADLPFADQIPCADAALALGAALGIGNISLESALRTYRERNCTKNILDLEDIRLLLNLSCKTSHAAQAAFDALSRESGRKIAVLGSDAWVCMAKKAGVETIFIFDKTERELEKELLAILQPGDAGLFLGKREDNLCTTVRRLFGITDGYIPNSEYWTGDEMLML
jgi:hypothetical protein